MRPIPHSFHSHFYSSLAIQLIWVNSVKEEEEMYCIHLLSACTHIANHYSLSSSSPVDAHPMKNHSQDESIDRTPADVGTSPPS